MVPGPLGAQPRVDTPQQPLIAAAGTNPARWRGSCAPSPPAGAAAIASHFRPTLATGLLLLLLPTCADGGGAPPGLLPLTDANRDAGGTKTDARPVRPPESDSGATPEPAAKPDAEAGPSARDAAPPPPAPTPIPPEPPTPGEACAVDPQRIFADLAHLASPELRGRKPGDPGNELSVQFAEKQFTAAGLAPAGDKQSFRQAFAFRAGGTTHNVLGVLAGSDPVLAKQVIIVGAHIDHLGVNRDGAINYGADDNASGAALVIELARLFKLCGVRPKRTVLFIEFNAEEMGLIGSRHYVDAPVFPLADTIAMFNFDMVGAGSGTGALIFGGTDARNAWMTELLRKTAAAGKLAHVIETVPQKLASDHAPFVETGVPSLFAFSRPDPHPGYHTPADDIDNIRPASLKVMAELFWAALRPLASGEEQAFVQRPTAGNDAAAQARKLALPPLTPWPQAAPCDHSLAPRSPRP